MARALPLAGMVVTAAMALSSMVLVGKVIPVVAEAVAAPPGSSQFGQRRPKSMQIPCSPHPISPGSSSIHDPAHDAGTHQPSPSAEALGLRIRTMMTQAIWTATLLTWICAPGCRGPAQSPTHGPATGHRASAHVGSIDADDILAQYPKFRASHEQYQPTPADLQAMAEIPDDIDIEVYFGTWCHDSQRELGRFIKLLQQSGRSVARVSYRGLTTSKRDQSGRAAQLGVRYTPTFVVFRNGRELGRIVESPRTSLARDIRALVSP